MTRQVLVIGHADADGHVIAEQVRRNLTMIPGFEVEVLVDPDRTQGHQSWLRLDLFPEIDQADTVFFVDLMFSPMMFDQETDSLADFARHRPDKMFFVIDHHPIPFARLGAAPNIRAAYRPDVFECAVGPRSGMMVIAAICERQGGIINNVRQPHHDTIARGVRRAAARGGQLPGKSLMSLLKADRWDVLYDLGQDDTAHHRLVRGRRLAGEHKSSVLNAAERVANKIEESFLNGKMPQSGDSDSRSAAMPYDAAIERYALAPDDPSRLRNEPIAAKDLEVLVTLLEVAALSLTIGPDSTFTREQLLAEAREIGGDGIVIDDRDVRVVLEKASFVERTAGELRLR